MIHSLKRSLFYLLVAGCFWQAQVAIAQPKKGTTTPATSTTKKPVDSEVKKLTIAFVENYGKFTQTKDKSSVLKFMHEKVASSLFNANVSGKYRSFTSDYQGFDEYLTKLANADNFNLNYKLTGIVTEHLSEDIGIGSVIYTADYQIEREGSIWEKGIEQVTLVFKKFGEDWKIIYYNSINIEDEKLRGDCFCELFESKPGNFVTKTTVPGGRGYTEDLQNFEFLQRPEGRIIRTANQVYQWSDEGAISYTPQRDSKASSVVPATVFLLGTAAEKEQAIILILKEVSYKESCANIKVRRK